MLVCEKQHEPIIDAILDDDAIGRDHAHARHSPMQVHDAPTGVERRGPAPTDQIDPGHGAGWAATTPTRDTLDVPAACRILGHHYDDLHVISFRDRVAH